MQRLADYISQFLIEQGIEDIFMLTGYGAMYLNDAIASSGIKHYATRNEATAPMMAEAYARVRGTLGVVCVTAGPGSTNAVPGLAEAFVDSAPILVISGQVHKKHTVYDSRIPGLRTFGTAEINIIPIVKPLTKYAVFVDDPGLIRYYLEKAVYFALEGRPGPVWLDIPLDVQQTMVDPGKLTSFVHPDSELNGNIDDNLDDVIHLLRNAKRPLVIAGHGIRQSGSIDIFKETIDGLKAPVLFSRLGQDILPHSYPHVFGHAGLKGSRYCKKIMQQADVVFSLGCRLAPQLVGMNFEGLDVDAKVIMVDIDKAELLKPGVHLTVPILGDVKYFLLRLLSRIENTLLPNWGEWLSFCEDARSSKPIITEDRKKNPIDLYYFMHKLDEASGPNHILVTDAGSNYYAGGQVWHFERGQREIASACNAAMGTTIPLAIGAAIARPDCQILAVTGDGSLELNVQELKTISHYNLNIKLFVINNGGYASMRKWQDDFDGRRIDTEEETGAGTLDLKRVAVAFGLDWISITDYRYIDVQISNMLSFKRPMFIEVVTDPNQKIIEAF